MNKYESKYMTSRDDIRRDQRIIEMRNIIGKDKHKASWLVVAGLISISSLISITLLILVFPNPFIGK